MRARAAAVLVLAVACSARDGPRRSLEFHGVTLLTSMPQQLTVIVEECDDADALRLLGYGVLGDSAGAQTVGGTLTPGVRLRLRVGVDAELWQQDGTAPAKLVQGKGLHGLAGANVDHGALELRAATSTCEVIVPPATRWSIGFDQGMFTIEQAK